MKRGRGWIQAIALTVLLALLVFAGITALKLWQRRMNPIEPNISGVLMLCPPTGQCQLHKAERIRFRDGYIQFDSGGHENVRSSFRWFLFPGSVEELFPKSKSKDG